MHSKGSSWKLSLIQQHTSVYIPHTLFPWADWEGTPSCRLSDF